MDGSGVAGPALSTRILAPLPWTSSCLDSDCALGTFAADALCGWATSSDAPNACLVPSRFLGGGLPAGSLAWEHLAEVVPPHMVITLTMRASHLRTILVSGQEAAWRQCPTAPNLSPSWQLSGARFSWSSCGSRSSSLSVRQRNGSFVQMADDAPVRVLTLAPALPLLGNAADFVSPAQLKAISAQHIVADYLRAHSPFNSSAAASTRRIVISPAACAPSACASKVDAIRAFRAVGLAEYHAAHAHGAASTGVAAGALALAVAAGACCFVMWARRMRGIVDERSPLAKSATDADASARRRTGSTPSPGGAEPSPSPQARPAFARDPEREPLRTGSQRLVSISELGP